MDPISWQEVIRKKRTKYPHFDPFLSIRDITSYKDIITDYDKFTEYLSSHPFLPFISRVKRTPKYKTITKKDGSAARVRIKDKRREFRYPSHRDSFVHSCYAMYLQKAYELELENRLLDDVVIAYRKIPVSTKDSHGKSVKHFANEVFDHIEKKGSCIALAFDISSFFDGINHRILKQKWVHLLGKDSLSDGEYKLFKFLTSSRYISQQTLFRLLGIKSIKKINKKYGQICSYKSFRELLNANKNLLGINTTGIGIPQGSPLSPVLSNIYLLKFDQWLNRYIQGIGGIYRRYADDMMVVCDIKYSEKIEDMISDRLWNDLLLKINADKTERIIFRRNFSGQLFVEGKQPLQYLGWEFNGKRRVIRRRSLSNYYRKMKQGSRQLIDEAIKRESPIPKRAIYSRYSRLKKKGSRNKNKTGLSSKKKKNFIDYAKFSGEFMEESDLKCLLRRHLKKIKNEINKTMKD